MSIFLSQGNGKLKVLFGGKEKRKEGREEEEGKGGKERRDQ